MAEKRVKLKSSDDEMFEVDEAVAFESQAVKNMIEDTGIDAPIPLPNVSSKILAKVIEYCKYHVENQKTSEDKPATPEDEIKAWDAEFVKVDQATLFDLILAANYLNIKNLLDLTRMGFSPAAGHDAIALPHIKSKSVAPALIAMRPDGACGVVAVGAHLRIFDFSSQSAVDIKDETVPALHGDAIRSVAFNVDGSLFATVGDDKRVKLWDSKTWSCIKTICLTKKVSAVTFSNDSAWFMVADKFGIVYVFSTSRGSVDEPVQLLAHCCSIITDMICSPDGKYIVTSDRDFKIRVTRFPERPLSGAHEIHTYCLGHNNFVTCLAFVGFEGLLVSGGGDCMVRLWEYESGTLLDTFDISQGEVGNTKEDSRAVLAAAASPTESTVAAIFERFEGVLIFTCDVTEKKLKLLKKVVTSGYSPSSISFDCKGNLWLVAGAAETVVKGDEFVTPDAVAAAQIQAHAIALAAVTHVQVVRDCLLLDGASVPGGDSLLRTLQGGEADVSKVQSATEAAEIAMKDLLSKRQYTVEQRENRKRMRNDKKVTSITSA